MSIARPKPTPVVYRRRATGETLIGLIQRQNIHVLGMRTEAIVDVLYVIATRKP